ncbi:uncharacterized protein LOC110176646 [Drosophila serrata]|uniref:uncharacterized protein LOC110176646 n=1 Tax=Drosophila serrata TaxID=7274 RepID=UPI000A1D0A79|nr:uncharacterized protein LOC110176646 [Drosophila serrata]
MKVTWSNGSRFNGGTSAGNQNPQLKLEMNAWQPFTQHNNWLILQATAPSLMQRQREEIPERRTEPERLPVNYYAYNHRYNNSVASPSAGGNYKPVPPTDPASYVLAISQQMRRGQILRQLPPAKETQPKQEMEPEQEPEPMPQPQPEVRKAAATLTHQANGDDDGDGENANEIDTLENEAGGELVSLRGIESYLAPFERALVKVRDICDTLRMAINGEEDEFVPNNLDATTSDAKASPFTVTSKELLVQGRSQRLAAETEGRKLKKLKKKIQKLLLPLLIAYKLKFLTLIPVLIGGLTLLVGTTGLAGFFFALFTAVMSLKSSAGGHASKALVLKKL